MDVQQVEHLNSVVEKMVDNNLHVLMDLEYHKVVLVELVIVVVVVFDSMDHFVVVVVDRTSFDYLFKTNKNKKNLFEIQESNRLIYACGGGGGCGWLIICPP
jgi:hypothetical protein